MAEGAEPYGGRVFGGGCNPVAQPGRYQQMIPACEQNVEPFKGKQSASPNQTNPLVLLLVVPKAFGRALSPGDDPLNSQAGPLQQQAGRLTGHPRGQIKQIHSPFPP